MYQSDVNMFLIANKDNLPEDKLPYIKARLEAMDPERLENIQFISFKSPIMMLIISFFLGEFGIDRFMLGDIGLGIGKLLTGGGCGIWWLIDLCLIMNATKEKNFQKLQMYL